MTAMASEIACSSALNNAGIIWQSGSFSNISSLTVKTRHTVSGTRDNHCYKPVGLGTLHVRRISGDDSFFTAKVSDADDLTLVPAAVQPAQDYQPGQYVACM